MLWRRRALIGSVVAAGLTTAAIYLAIVPRHYTAEAIVQLDFNRDDHVTSVPTMAGTSVPASPSHSSSAPPVSVEGAALAESETRLLNSRSLARKVALRLGLNEAVQDPAEYSVLQRFISHLRATFLPEYQVDDRVEKAAIDLGRHLNVVTAPRSYVMSVSFTAKAPEQAALIANTFVDEYFKVKASQSLLKREETAREQVVSLSSVYGTKHPALMAAKANLDSIEQERTRIESGSAADQHSIIGASFLPAQVNPIPSSPKGLLTLGISFIASLLCGVGLAYWMDRKNGDFGTPTEVAALTSLPCLGVLPAPRGNASDQDFESAMHAIGVDTGILGPDESCKVVMIASALEDDGASDLTTALFGFLRSHGYRVLCIDPRQAQKEENAHSLKGVLNDSEAARAVISADRDRRKGALVCFHGEDDGHSLLSVRPMQRFLKAARKAYDVILIKAPPVLDVPQAALLAHLSDICLHVVSWKKTPRSAMRSSLSRLRKTQTPVTGVILTGVSSEEVDPTVKQLVGRLVERLSYFLRDVRVASGTVSGRIKRFVDLSASLLAGLLSLPFIVASAVAIWLIDRGSPFYSQKRIGEGPEATDDASRRRTTS
jgi:Mrp family chromosome partitioning ATPase